MPTRSLTPDRAGGTRNTMKKLMNGGSKLLLIATAAVLPLAGCQSTQPPPPTASVPPVAPDEAMQHRADWQRVTQYYPSGAVIAGHTCFLFAPAGPEWTRSITETP